jgi:competence protein ComEC
MALARAGDVSLLAPRIAPPLRRALRIDPVLVMASSACLGASACVAPEMVLAVGALCLLIISSRLSLLQFCLAAMALSIGWARAASVLDEFSHEQERARSFLGTPRRCAMLGEVSSSPALDDGWLRFDAVLRELDCEGQLDRQPVRARLYTRPSALGRGDSFSAIGDLGPVSLFRNLALPDPRPTAARQGAVLSGALLALDVTRRGHGAAAFIDRARAHVRRRIDATFSARVRGMARALVLGETDLSAADEQAFRKSGLSHLLAVSGTHLVIAVLALVRALEALLRRWQWLASRSDVRRHAACVGLILAPLYADFAGGSGSAWRAAYMLLIVLGVRALGYHVFTSRVLAGSLGLGWLRDALVLFDPSFSLSVAATVGLLCMGRRPEEGLLTSSTDLTQPQSPDGPRLARRMGQAALTTLAAALPCTPILLLIAPGFSLASVAANLLAGPLGEAVALPLCLAHALLSPLPALERGVALVASGALALIRELAHASAGVEWLYFELPPPGRWHLGTLALGVVGHISLAGQPWLGRHARVAAGAARASWLWAAACVLTFAIVEANTVKQSSADFIRERGRLRIEALDVGQGDATLIDLPDGRLLLLDAGGAIGGGADPGERVVLASLRARRRQHLDIVVLSHPHPDHYGGLLAVAAGVSIGELWYGGEGAPAPGASAGPAAAPGPHALLLARLREKGVRLRSARELCGVSQGTPAYVLEVLAPCPDVAPDQSANDNSLVLRLSLGRRTALLMGDAENWAEQRLLKRQPDQLRADFLKVGHHGSRTSSSAEFIARVAPRVATISCGSRNRFGHPHAETLATLAAAGALTLRLDESGGVSWETDGERESLRVFSARPAQSSVSEPP